MPNLNLPVPGVTPGTEWASRNNAALNALNEVMETGRLSPDGLEGQLVEIAAELNPETLSDVFVAQQISTSGTESSNAVSSSTLQYNISSVAPGLTTDAGAVIQAAINSAPDRSTIYFPRGVFPQRSPIVVPESKSLRIIRHGCKLVRTGTDEFIQLTVLGGFGSQLPVSTLSYLQETIGGFPIDMTDITIPGGHDYLVGDIVKLISDDLIPGGRKSSSTRFPRQGEQLFIYSISGNTVRLLGKPSAFPEAYTDNIRVARKNPGSCYLEGGEFDVSDEVWSTKRKSDAVIRLESVMSVTDRDAIIHRSIGTAFNMRGCLNSTFENPFTKWAYNNPAATEDDPVPTFGYGIQITGSQNCQVKGGQQWFTRHGYDEKSTDLTAGSTATGSYGASIGNKVIALTVENSSGTCFSTHQESYGTTFISPIGRRSGSGGMGLRGSRISVIKPVMEDVRYGISVFTESNSGYTNGETRRVEVTDPTIRNAEFAFHTNIRTGTHPFLNVKDTQQNLTVGGVASLSNVQNLSYAINANVTFGDVRWGVADNPPRIFGVMHRNTNTQLLGAIYVDGSQVTTSQAANHVLFWTAAQSGAVSPSAELISSSQVYVKLSDYFAARFEGGFFNFDANTVAMIPDLVISRPLFSPGRPVMSVGSWGPKVEVDWKYHTQDLGSGSYNSSAYLELSGTDIASADRVRELLLSGRKNLRLLCIPATGGNTLATLPNGKFRGQKLEITNSSSSNSLTVRNGQGTTLSTGADISVTGFRSLNLEWIGTTWRNLPSAV